MIREEKANIIAELTEKLEQSSFFYIADASGLTVTEINAFRGMCFEGGVEYKVYKNTFIKKALEALEADYTAFTEEGVLKGTSGIMFVQDENQGNVPAKVIQKFRKELGAESGKPILKGASIQSDLFIGDDQLKVLASLKSKGELIGEVIGLLQSPAKNVISALTSGKSTLAGLVKALAEKE